MSNLHDVVTGFAAKHPECADGELVGDRCFAYSEAFVALLPEHDTEVVSGVWMNVEARIIYAGHAAARVDDQVYDWTARQFDPAAPVPLVTPLATWREMWKALR